MINGALFWFTFILTSRKAKVSLSLKKKRCSISFIEIEFFGGKITAEEVMKVFNSEQF